MKIFRNGEPRTVFIKITLLLFSPFLSINYLFILSSRLLKHLVIRKPSKERRHFATAKKNSFGVKISQSCETNKNNLIQFPDCTENE